MLPQDRRPKAKRSCRALFHPQAALEDDEERANALLSPPLWVMCAVSFCFFLLTTLPKIGFATLLQSLAAQADASGRVFGFVASFVTMCDAAVMLLLSLLFGALPLRAALWAACGLFAAVGLLEGTLGRHLVSERRSSPYAADAYVPYSGA